MFNFVSKRFVGMLFIFSVIGPGLITSMVDNDAGGIATYSVAGAHFGYAFLWTIIPVTFVLIIIQEMCARIGVVSGKGLSDLIREIYGVKVTFYILMALLAANLSTIVAEFSGIAGSMEIFGVSRYISVPAGVLLVWWVVIKGNYKSVEKICMVGAILYISYIVSGFLAKPEWTVVAKEMFHPTVQFSKEYLMLLIGMVGTTITPWMQFYIQASIVEKGVKIENYKYTKLDITVGSIVTEIVTFFIIVASAATLFAHNIRIEGASDAARALMPFAGEAAGGLFALGLLNASLLGAMIVSISTAYSVCEGLGFESGVNTTFKQAPWFNGIITGLLILGAIPAMFPQTPLIKVMLWAQVVNGILLAPVLVFIVLLVNKKWLMGEHVNKPFYNVVVWLAVAVLVGLSLTLFVTGL